MGSENDDGLTDRQREVLDAVRDHWREHATSPTIRYLQARFKYASTNGVVSHLTALNRRKAIEWVRNGKSRMIFPAGLRERIKGVV